MITTSSGTKYYTQEEIDTKDKVIVDLQKLVQELQSDGRQIAAALREEAEDRDWCESYNTFVNELNYQTTHIRLVPLEREFSVEVTVTRTQTQRITVSINAINDDVANDEFYSNQDDYADTYLRDDEWQDESVEYEIERIDEA